MIEDFTCELSGDKDGRTSRILAEVLNDILDRLDELEKRMDVVDSRFLNLIDTIAILYRQ